MRNEDFIVLEQGRTDLTLLSELELNRLREINRRLQETERWIHDRARRALADYRERGGKQSCQLDDSSFEDVLVDVTVDFILSREHCRFRADDDNIIARLDYDESLEEHLGGHDWNEGPHPNALSTERICWLFHDLCWHTFGGDYDKVLAVGGVWVDVHVIEQRIVSWI